MMRPMCFHNYSDWLSKEAFWKPISPQNYLISPITFGSLSSWSLESDTLGLRNIVQLCLNCTPHLQWHNITDNIGAALCSFFPTTWRDCCVFCMIQHSALNIFWLFLIGCYKFADWLGLFVLGLSICGVGVCSMRQGKAIHHRLISSKTETHSLHPAAYRGTCSKGYSDLTNCQNLQNQICADMMIWNYKCILSPHETYSYAEAYYYTYSIATHINSELRTVGNLRKIAFVVWSKL